MFVNVELFYLQRGLKSFPAEKQDSVTHFATPLLLGIVLNLKDRRAVGEKKRMEAQKLS